MSKYKINLRKPYAIIGVVILATTIITYNIGTAAVQELGKQSSTNFFPQELKS